jgi:hypothetical protein
MKNSRFAAVFGSGLVLVGSFLPIIHVPVYGSITLLETNVGGVTVLAAFIGVLMGALGFWIPMRIAAAVCFGTWLFFLSNVYLRLMGNRTQIRAITESLGGSFSIDYAVMFVIGIGVILMLINSQVTPIFGQKNTK